MSAQPEPSERDDAKHHARLREILDDAGTVMMVTRVGDALASRPMAVVRVDDDATMYFATGASTGKVADLEADPRVDLFFQSKRQFATVHGRVALRRDRALIDELWTASWKLWFPEGKDDPEIVVLVVTPEGGEYWDQTGVQGLSFLYRAAKALATGTELEHEPDDHVRVRM